MKHLIVANWKMNPFVIKEAEKVAKAVEMANSNKNEVVICPPFLFLEKLGKIIKKTKLGAQNCFWEKEGAFTGEISPRQLKNLGVRYVIIGHSERRKMGESDEIIIKKVATAKQEGLSIILCVGENEEEKRANKTKAVIETQLKKIKEEVIVAYEPIWAIGTGQSCHYSEAEKIRIFIKEMRGSTSLILYGGSVNSKNAGDYLKKAKFSGLLIGGVSLNLKEFQKIINN